MIFGTRIFKIFDVILNSVQASFQMETSNLAAYFDRAHIFDIQVPSNRMHQFFSVILDLNQRLCCMKFEYYEFIQQDVVIF